MRLFVYDMLVNVNVIYYVHVCEQARWARSAGNSAIENLCIIIIICQNTPTVRACRISAKASKLKMYMQQIDYFLFCPVWVYSQQINWNWRKQTNLKTKQNDNKL